MIACLRCDTALEDGDLRCAICAFAVPAPAVSSVPYAQVLRCRDCGAAVAFVAEAQAPRCGFCGATMAIEQPIDPIETAQQRLPFAVDREAAEAAVRGWLAGRGRGWFAPPALLRDAVLESLAPLAWAAWRVNAQAQVTWTADSDADAQRSAWAPHAGGTSLAFRDILVPASRGLRASECQRLVPYYDVAPAIAVDHPLGAAEVAPGIESFEAQRAAARSYVQGRIEAIARVTIEASIPGRRFRNVRVACLVERQTTERIALPAWVLAYRHRGRPYRAIVHGQRAEIVVGRSPIDRAKVAAVIAAIAVIGLAALVLAHGAP